MCFFEPWCLGGEKMNCQAPRHQEGAKSSNLNAKTQGCKAAKAKILSLAERAGNAEKGKGRRFFKNIFFEPWCLGGEKMNCHEGSKAQIEIY